MGKGPERMGRRRFLLGTAAGGVAFLTGSDTVRAGNETQRMPQSGVVFDAKVLILLLAAYSTTAIGNTIVYGTEWIPGKKGAASLVERMRQRGQRKKINHLLRDVPALDSFE